MPGGDLEYTVLVALWDLGCATVREIHDRVSKANGLAYTTTGKVVDRLLAKRLISRHREGNAYVYGPAIRRSTVDRFRAKSAFDRLLATDPRPVLASLVDAIVTIDPELLDDLSEELKKRRSRRGT